MWQSEVTEYFHSRKRNSNFQPSKRQKVQVETGNSVPSNVTLQVSKSSRPKKTDSSAVQIKSAAKIPDSKKHSTRSRIPKLQKESRNFRLDDIWKKPSDTTLPDDLNNKLSQNYNSPICHSAASHWNVKNCLSDDNKDASCITVDTTKTESGDRLPVSPSKRQLQEYDTEKSETNAVTDVATEAVDDHGNSHPCTPVKRRTVEHSIVTGASHNKRGRCLVPTNSSNYYETPHKFDFSPYQLTVANQRSSSARKKLVLPNANVTKSPPMFVFKGSIEKFPESSVAIKTKDKSLTDVQKDARDVAIKLSDKVECDAGQNELLDETSFSTNRDIKEAETPCKHGASVAKIGTCRNLEQLKQKLRDFSPRKAKVSDAVGDTSSVSQRYVYLDLLCNVIR